MDNDTCIRLINLYKNYNSLWNLKHVNYHNSSLRDEAWKEISSVLKRPIPELKTKMRSLMGTYRREKSRIKQSLKAGETGNVKIYESKWFAFECFSFLSNRDDRYQTNETLSKLEPEISIHEQSGNNNKDEQEEQDTLACTKDECSAAVQQAQSKKKRMASSSSSVEASNASEQQNESIKALSSEDNQQQVNKKKRSNATVMNDPILQKAFTLFQKKSAEMNKDPYFSYGQYIANELRKYTPETLVFVKKAINNIIFEADLGRFHSSNYEERFDEQPYISPGDVQSSSGTCTPLPTGLSPALQYTSFHPQDKMDNDDNATEESD